MVHSSGEKRTDILNWALNVFLVKVLERHESRGAVFGVALSFVVALPSVNGKTHRDDLPDNGFRFLPSDVEKIIPSSIPFDDRAIELEGNAPALKKSFIGLWIIFPIVVISLAFLSWMRRRKDQELYERALETYHTKKEMLDRSERLTSELCEKNTGIQAWTSVHFPPEEQPGVDMRRPKTETQRDENQISHKENIATQMQAQTQNDRLANHFPQVAVSIYPHLQDTLEPAVVTPPLTKRSDSPSSAVSSGTKPETIIVKEDEIEEDFPIPENRKMKIDSIVVYCEKKKKLSKGS